MRQHPWSCVPYSSEAESCISPIGKLACDYQQPERQPLSQSFRTKCDTHVTSVHYLRALQSITTVMRRIPSVARTSLTESRIVYAYETMTRAASSSTITRSVGRTTREALVLARLAPKKPPVSIPAASSNPSLTCTWPAIP